MRTCFPIKIPGPPTDQHEATITLALASCNYKQQSKHRCSNSHVSHAATPRRTVKFRILCSGNAIGQPSCRLLLGLLHLLVVPVMTAGTHMRTHTHARQTGTSKADACATAVDCDNNCGLLRSYAHVKTARVPNLGACHAARATPTRQTNARHSLVKPVPLRCFEGAVQFDERAEVQLLVSDQVELFHVLLAQWAHFIFQVTAWCMMDRRIDRRIVIRVCAGVHVIRADNEQKTHPRMENNARSSAKSTLSLLSVSTC